jgi:Bax protein
MLSSSLRGLRLKWWRFRQRVRNSPTILLRPLAIIALVGALVTAAWWFTLEPPVDFGPVPDFAAIEDVKQMKAAFYGYLAPIVLYHNEQIDLQRQRLLAIDIHLQDAGSLHFFDERFLKKLAAAYEIEWDKERAPALAQDLLERVDIIPVELALVQAAMESAWGRSRFALEANNYLGQWCYRRGCGLVPVGRIIGRRHEIEKFDTVAEGIRRYMNNLNTHRSYQELRNIRAQLRAADEPVTGEALAQGLIMYSERREEYVKEVRSMIRGYQKSVSRAGDDL